MKSCRITLATLAAASVFALAAPTVVAEVPSLAVDTAANLTDPAQLLQQARMHADAGETDAAIAILDELRLSYPLDVDYAFARAQILARQGRDAEALVDLRDAVSLAPDYEDVRQLYATLLARQPSGADNTAQWSLLAGAGHQNLDHGLPSWNQQFFEVSRRRKDRGGYRAGIARDERYDNADVSVLLGGDVQFASDWLAGFAVTVASGADFQADLDYSANIGRSLKDGWVIGLLYRHRAYATTAVTSTTAAVEKYLGNFRAAYALGASTLPGASQLLNHAFSINWYYNDRSSIGLTVNSGKEAEVIGPGLVLETDVRGVSFSGRRQLNERFGLQWWLGRHEQGDYYQRDYFGLAVSIKL
jgi:YaiO family outer membrane protein